MPDFVKVLEHLIECSARMKIEITKNKLHEGIIRFYSRKNGFWLFCWYWKNDINYTEINGGVGNHWTLIFDNHIIY